MNRIPLASVTIEKIKGKKQIEFELNIDAISVMIDKCEFPIRINKLIPGDVVAYLIGLGYFVKDNYNQKDGHETIIDVYEVTE